MPVGSWRAWQRGCCSMDVSTATSIDSAILIFREAGLGKRHRLVKRRMRPSSPAAWLLQKPRRSSSRTARFITVLGDAKTFLKMPLEQACHWRPRSNEERPPVQYVARQRLRRFFGGVLQGHGSLRIHGFKNVSARHGTLTLPPCSVAAACTQTTIL